MRERLEAQLGPEAAGELFAGTFHSLCYRILKRHIGELPGAGRTAAFTIYDQVGEGRLKQGRSRLLRRAGSQPGLLWGRSPEHWILAG